jgi:hypothetical protein
MPAIARALGASRVLVLVFSARANASRHVAREVSIAFNEEMPILPFRVEEVQPGTALRYAIGTTHWLDALTPPLERHLTALADRVAALIASGGQDTGTVKVPVVSRARAAESREHVPAAAAVIRKLPTWALAGGALGLLALVLVAAMSWSSRSPGDPGIRPVEPTPVDPTPVEPRPVTPPPDRPPDPKETAPRPESPKDRRVAPDPAPIRPQPSPPSDGRSAPARPANSSEQILTAHLGTFMVCSRVTSRSSTAPPAPAAPPAAVDAGASGSMVERQRLRKQALEEQANRIAQNLSAQAMRNSERIRLATYDLAFLTTMADRPAFPFVVCHSSFRSSSGHWRHWAAAQEVRLGASAGSLSTVAPVWLTGAAADAQERATLLGEDPAFDIGQPFWHAFLPALTTEVYASVVFHDGSSSPVLRVQQIRQVNLTQ